MATKADLAALELPRRTAPGRDADRRADLRTRGGRAVSLAAALLFLLLVLVGVPLIERLPALLTAAAEALRSIGA